MDLIFIGLSLGCAVFLGKIIMDYLNEVPVWKERIDQADIEMGQYETEIQDLTQQKESASKQSKSIDDEIKKMDSMAAELKAEIEKTKKEMARKGKIIMRREPDQESG
jgi:peptidoglycan hydrolase CwlO-like protein